MGYTEIDITDMPREDWLALRRGYIGGSDAAAVVGLSPWTSPYALALDKLGTLPDRDIGEAGLWGNKLERIVAEHALEQQGAGWFGDFTCKDHMYVSTKYPWAAVNLDGIFYTAPGDARMDVGYEGKTASEFKLEEWEDGNCPVAYRIQVLHAMAVRDDLPRFLVSALVGGNKYRQAWVERDEEAIATLMEHERLFWEMVQRGEVPAPSGSDFDKDILVGLHPTAEGELTLSDDVLGLAEAYKAAAQDAKDAEAHKKEAGNLLRLALGDARIGRVGPATITRIISEVPEHLVKASTRDYITVRL
jgi:putative phage-type endonuclease